MDILGPRVYMALCSPIYVSAPKVMVTEWPKSLPYSSSSYRCRKPTEAGQVSLEWRSTALTLR